MSDAGKASINTGTVVLTEAVVDGLTDPAPLAFLQHADLDQSFEPTLVIDSDATDFSDVEGDEAEKTRNSPPHPKQPESQSSAHSRDVGKQGRETIGPIEASLLRMAYGQDVTVTRIRVPTSDARG